MTTSQTIATSFLYFIIAPSPALAMMLCNQPPLKLSGHNNKLISFSRQLWVIFNSIDLDWVCLQVSYWNQVFHNVAVNLHGEAVIWGILFVIAQEFKKET